MTVGSLFASIGGIAVWGASAQRMMDDLSAGFRIAGPDEAIIRIDSLRALYEAVYRDVAKVSGEHLLEAERALGEAEERALGEAEERRGGRSVADNPQRIWDRPLHPVRLDLDDEDGRMCPLRYLRAIVRMERGRPAIYIRFGSWGTVRLGGLSRASHLAAELQAAIRDASEMQRAREDVGKL